MKFNRVLSNKKQLIKLLRQIMVRKPLHIKGKRKIIPDIIVLDLNMPKINGIEF
jgi:CheY-like chemotaxis protein